MFISQTPVTHCRREWISALVGGAASLAGGLFGAAGSSKASSNSLKATRETNELNYKIWQEQRQHNLDMYNLQVQDEWKMWNAQNEYNNMVNQRQRLEDAGYNPYLALGGANNTAQGMSVPNVNPSQVPTMQAPDISAFYNGWNAVGDTLNNVVPTFQALADLGRTRAETVKAIADAGKSNADAGKSNAETDAIRWQTDFNRKTEEIQRKGLELVNDQIQADIDLKNAQRLLTTANNQTVNVLNQWLPQEKQVAYLTSVQNLYNLYVEGKLSLKQIEKIGTSMLVDMAQVRNLDAQSNLYNSQAVYTDAQTYGQRISNSMATATFNDLLKQCQNQTISSGYDLETSQYRSWNSWKRYQNLLKFGYEEWQPSYLGGLANDFIHMFEY